MFPGLNGKRKQPDWLRHIDHCRPVKRAAFALDAPLGLEHTLPALQVARTAGLGDGAQLCMLLVTVQPVKAVVAQMKDQVYVSITDYISIAKGKLIGHGHTWNESHHREARRGTRSEICGKDTAKQDEGLDLGTAFRLGIGTDPLVPGDMCNFVLALEVGTVFTLREIELSASPASAVAFDKEKFAVTVALPVSRADPVAIECSGTRGCVERGQRDTPCCYPALTEQLDWLDRTFPEVPRGSLPLFPQCNGDAAGKTSVVKSAEYVACILGEDLVNQQGRNLLLRSQYQDYGGEKFCLVRHTYGHGYAPLGRVLRRNSTLHSGARLTSTKTGKRFQDHASDYQRHEEKFLAPAVHIDMNGTRTCFPQFAMNRSSGIYRRACTTSPFETGHGTRVSACVRLYHSGNSIRSDKTPSGRVPGGPAQQMPAH